MTKQIPIGYQPRDYQKLLWEYYNAGTRKFFLVWPRQIGKDTTCWAFMVSRMVVQPGNYFYIFPTKEMARRALWEKNMTDESEGQKLLDMLPMDPKAGFVKRISNQEMVIELHNGSTLRVVGLDTNPDSIRGITPKGVVFSEFAFSDIEAYKALLPALRGDSWQIINSTPNGRNHFYDMYQGCHNRKEWCVSHLQGLWPEKENYIHIHDKQYFQDLVDAGINTWEEVEREFGCCFSTGMTGSYYIDQIEKAYSSDRIGLLPYDDNLLVHTSWDIGVSDSTAIWFYQVKNNAIIFIDYYEDHGKGTDHYARVLREKGYTYGTHYLPHDANNRKQGKTISSTAEDLEDSILEMNMSADIEVCERIPIQDGINAVRKKFNSFYFDRGNCEEGLRKLELYHKKFDKKTRAYSKVPVHDANSHAADAIRTMAIADDPRNDYFYKDNDIKVITSNDLFQ